MQKTGGTGGDEGGGIGRAFAFFFIAAEGFDGNFFAAGVNIHPFTTLRKLGYGIFFFIDYSLKMFCLKKFVLLDFCCIIIDIMIYFNYNLDPKGRVKRFLQISS